MHKTNWTRAKKCFSELAFTAFIMAEILINVSGSTTTSQPHHIHKVQHSHKANSFIRKTDGSVKGFSGTKQSGSDKLQTNRNNTCRGTTVDHYHNTMDTNRFSAEDNKWYNIPMRWRSTHPGDNKCRKKSRHSWHITDSATVNMNYV